MKFPLLIRLPTKSSITCDYLSQGLELPDLEPMEIVGDPRHRRLMGASIRYGIPFLPEATEHFEAKRLEIYRYVHRRQIEMIEALRAMPA